MTGERAPSPNIVGVLFALDVLVTLASRRRCFLSTDERYFRARGQSRGFFAAALCRVSGVRNGAHDIIPGLKTVRMMPT